MEANPNSKKTAEYWETVHANKWSFFSVKFIYSFISLLIVIATTSLHFFIVVIQSTFSQILSASPITILLRHHCYILIKWHFLVFRKIFLIIKLNYRFAFISKLFMWMVTYNQWLVYCIPIKYIYVDYIGTFVFIILQTNSSFFYRVSQY